MQLKIGANGELNVYVEADGDIALEFKDSEVLTEQSAKVALHPAVVSASLVKLFGGSPLVQQIVGFAIPALVALLPKQP